MFFNWLKKESKINNQREELLKEAQKMRTEWILVYPKRPCQRVVQSNKRSKTLTK